MERLRSLSNSISISIFLSDRTQLAALHKRDLKNIELAGKIAGTMLQKILGVH